MRKEEKLNGVNPFTIFLVVFGLVLLLALVTEPSRINEWPKSIALWCVSAFNALLLLWPVSLLLVWILIRQSLIKKRLSDIEEMLNIEDGAASRVTEPPNVADGAKPFPIEGMESWNPITGSNSFGPGKGLNPSTVDETSESDHSEEETDPDKPDT